MTELVLQQLHPTCVTAESSEMWLHPYITAFKSMHVYVCVWVSALFIKQRKTLTRIPANCFSSILQDPGGKDPLPLRCVLTQSRWDPSASHLSELEVL